MPLFPSTTTPPTSGELLAQQTLTIRRLNKSTFNTLIDISNSYVRLVWYSFQFTPQQIIDSLSADAPNQLNYAANLRSYILSVASTEGIPVSSLNLLRPISAYSIVGSTVTLIPSAYSGP